MQALPRSDTGGVWTVRWSPHQTPEGSSTAADQSLFVVATSELRLYSLTVAASPSPPSPPPQRRPRILRRSPDNPLSGPRLDCKLLSSCGYAEDALTCLDWSPIEEKPLLIAAGLRSGKVTLLDLGGSSDLHSPRVVADFVPIYSRRCNAVGFNPVLKQQMAVGLDKVRNAQCALVWDLTRSPNTKSSVSSSHGNPIYFEGTHPADEANDPIAQFSNSEAVHALSWLPTQPCCLAVAAGLKWLRLYDLRVPNEALTALGTHQKPIRGIYPAPFRSHQIASFSEDGVVNVWDVRAMRRRHPHLLTMSLPSSMSLFQWSPTKAGVFASICNGENTLSIHNIDSRLSSAERMSVPSSGPVKVSSVGVRHKSFMSDPYSLSWHPVHPNRLLVLTHDGTVHHRLVHDQVPVSLSPHSELSFGCDEVLFLYSPVFSDVSSTMYHRVQNDYSLDPIANMALFADTQPTADASLHSLWSWIQQSRSFWSQHGSQNQAAAQNRRSPPRQRSRAVELGGIWRCLHTGTDSSVHLEIAPSAPMRPKRNLGLDGFTVFRSAHRAEALSLLGFCDIDDRQALKDQLNTLKQADKYEAAALFAILHLDLHSAIDVLSEGAHAKGESGLLLDCVALAGYRPDSISILETKTSVSAPTSSLSSSPNLWAHTCSSLRRTLPSAYLRATFAFLCSDYDALLNDSSLDFRFRAGFACRFAEDETLREFVEKNIRVSTEQGLLEGLVIRGIGAGAAGILQAYLDRTSDIQTVALLSCFAVSSLVRSDSDASKSKFADWINAYRDLVDNWKCWHYRAKLDVARNQLSGERCLAESQVYARCNYCSQPLSLSQLSSSTRRPGCTSLGRLNHGRSMPMSLAVSAGSSSQRSRISGCPSCKKPLPRCSVCLMLLDCAVPKHKHGSRYRNLGRQKHDKSVSSRQESFDDAAATPQDDMDSCLFDKWFTWCQTCHHSAHAAHLAEWFANHEECPVSGCTCRCRSQYEPGLAS